MKRRVVKPKLALVAEQIRILEVALDDVRGGRPQCSEHDSTCSSHPPGSDGC